jgi:tetratricopeptide (TPR) repeat protein
MKHPSYTSRLGLLMTAVVFCVSAIRAQQAPQAQPSPPQAQPKENSTAVPNQEQAAPARTDPGEEAAYKEIYSTNDSDPNKVIQLGEAFVQKYPSGRYTSEVYGRLVTAYLSKQELDKMYAAGDKALALNPDNVNALVVVGWVIPHYYDPNDMDADRKLDKAEGYLKHAIALFATMQKPPQMTDEQFAKAKANGLSQAHSGLGLVYFRQGDSANSIAELQQAESLTDKPDPTDSYVMGMDYNSEKKYTEAAEAFNKCAAQPGGLVGACKQAADQAKKAAAAPPK